MAVTPPRFWLENYLFTGATLDPSSETTGNPVEALEDQQRTYYWQTAVGWTITDHNNKLDFDLGGAEKTATIVNGYYSTGAALATAIVTALEAADSAPVWACTYDSGTHKFTINQGSVFTIRWSTGTNAYRNIGRSLGYVVSSNDTGAISYLADAASYQSEHFLVITLTAAQAAATVTGAAVIGHNDGVTGAANIFRLESSATNAWSAPTTQANFAGCFADTRKYFASSAHQFWRLHVDASPFTSGYFRLGVLFLSPYISLPYCFSDNQSRKPGDYSTINTGIGGAHFANFRNRQRRRNFEVSQVENSTIATGLAETVSAYFEQLSRGENFILDFYPDDGLGIYGFAYGFLPDTEAMAYVPGNYWTFNFEFWEAL